MCDMSGDEGMRIDREQRLVIWRWLLDGYPPVAHIVADLDQVENGAPIVPRPRTPNAVAKEHGQRCQRSRDSNARIDAAAIHLVVSP
jgi:hypothetical protein